MLLSAVAVVALSLSVLPCMAQAAGDSILGDYSSKQKNDEYKVHVTKNDDGTYKAQIFWVSDPVDHETGKVLLDTKNPDKSLRNVPCDQIVLFDGLRYNAAKGQWDKTKIYDPQRGIRAGVTIKAVSADRLSVTGSVLGIGETVYWDRIK